MARWAESILLHCRIESVPEDGLKSLPADGGAVGAAVSANALHALGRGFESLTAYHLAEIFSFACESSAFTLTSTILNS